jgi:hypothetical protein
MSNLTVLIGTTFSFAFSRVDWLEFIEAFARGSAGLVNQLRSWTTNSKSSKSVLAQNRRRCLLLISSKYFEQQPYLQLQSCLITQARS